MVEFQMFKQVKWVEIYLLIIILIYLFQNKVLNKANQIQRKKMIGLCMKFLEDKIL